MQLVVSDYTFLNVIGRKKGEMPFLYGIQWKMSELYNDDVNNSEKQLNEDGGKAENIVRLADDTGYEMDFLVLDTVEYEYEQYDVLVPATKADSEDYAQVLILRKEFDISSPSAYSVVMDREITSKVFEIFKEMHGNKDLFTS